MILRPPEFNLISQPTPESRFSIEATLNWCIPSLTFKLPNVTRPPKPKPGIRRICIHFIALRLRVEENLRDQIIYSVIAAKHIDRAADTSRAKKSQITRACSPLMLHTWLVGFISQPTDAKRGESRTLGSSFLPMPPLATTGLELETCLGGFSLKPVYLLQGVKGLATWMAWRTSLVVRTPGLDLQTQ